MTIWNGFKATEFKFKDQDAIIVFPEGTGSGRWLLKTEYWGAFPEVEIELIKRGFHVAYVKNANRFATKEDCDMKACFTKYISKTYGLRDTCVPVGMSLGGAHAINFAGFYPELVECIYLDAPVLNFVNFPGKTGPDSYDSIWENEFIKAYPGITRAKLFSFDNHPIGKVDILKAHKIPIIMLYGVEDQTVDYDENGKLLELEYQDTPELLTVIPRQMQGHHPHGCLPDLAPLLDFIMEHPAK